MLWHTFDHLLYVTFSCNKVRLVKVPTHTCSFFWECLTLQVLLLFMHDDTAEWDTASGVSHDESQQPLNCKTIEHRQL